MSVVLLIGNNMISVQISVAATNATLCESAPHAFYRYLAIALTNQRNNSQ